MCDTPSRTVIIGLGSPLLSDDRVGLCVAQQLAVRLAGRVDVEVREDYRGGLDLMESLAGFGRAIIVDAIITGAEPGTIHRLSPEDIPTQKTATAHDVNLPTALELGRRMGVALPPADAVVLFGIEAADVLTFAEQCTPAVEAAIPRVIEMVLAELGV